MATATGSIPLWSYNVKKWIIRKSDGKLVYYGKRSDKPSLSDNNIYEEVSVPQPSKNHIWQNGAWVFSQSEEDTGKVAENKRKAEKLLWESWEKCCCYLECDKAVQTLPFTFVKFQEWSTYRNDLRAIRDGNNPNPTWPTKPT